MCISYLSAPGTKSVTFIHSVKEQRATLAFQSLACEAPSQVRGGGGKRLSSWWADRQGGRKEKEMGKQRERETGRRRGRAKWKEEEEKERERDPGTRFLLLGPSAASSSPQMAQCELS